MRPGQLHRDWTVVRKLLVRISLATSGRPGATVRLANLTAPVFCQVVELPSVHLLHIFLHAVHALTTP